MNSSKPRSSASFFAYAAASTLFAALSRQRKRIFLMI
jgi:hypothetical protein